MKRKTMLRLAAAAFAALLCLSGCAGEKEATQTHVATTTVPVTTTTPVTTLDPGISEPEVEDNGWVSAIFGGGPFCNGERGLKDVKEAGWDTIMLWSVHVHSDGTLYMNDLKVCENGEFVGGDTMKEGWQYLKEAPTSVKRIELSVGAWGTADFESIAALIARDGIGEDTILYRNFKALVDASGADAINYDDESNYNVDDAVEFGRMVESMGLKVTLCPYTAMSYWVDVYKGLGSDLCDRIYLQCYDGGAGNNVREWYNAFGGVKIIPGYWCLHYNNSAGDTAAQVQQKLENVKRCSTGGFMWLYDDMKYLASPNKTADYVEAIESVGE
ncbi:MAG: lysyl endopeptidase [Clostridia bacterium]|nr:lysyl endopeptidase [Clostridia bacterium]